MADYWSFGRIVRYLALAASLVTLDAGCSLVAPEYYANQKRIAAEMKKKQAQKEQSAASPKPDLEKRLVPDEPGMVSASQPSSQPAPQQYAQPAPQPPPRPTPPPKPRQSPKPVAQSKSPVPGPAPVAPFPNQPAPDKPKQAYKKLAKPTKAAQKPAQRPNPIKQPPSPKPGQSLEQKIGTSPSKHPTVEGPPPVGGIPIEIEPEVGMEVKPHGKTCINGKIEMVKRRMPIHKIIRAALIYHNLPMEYKAKEWLPVRKKGRRRGRTRYTLQSVNINNWAIYLSLASVESAFKWYVTSKAGAAGLMQFIPVSARRSYNNLSKDHCELSLEKMVILNPEIKVWKRVKVKGKRRKQRRVVRTYKVLPTVNKSVRGRRLRWYGKELKRVVKSERKEIADLDEKYTRQKSRDIKSHHRLRKRLARSSAREAAKDVDGDLKIIRLAAFAQYNEAKKRIASDVKGRSAQLRALRKLRKEFNSQMKKTSKSFRAMKKRRINEVVDEALEEFDREFRMKRAAIEIDYERKRDVLDQDSYDTLHPADARFHLFYNPVAAIHHFREIQEKYTGKTIRYIAKRKGKRISVVRYFQGTSAIAVTAIGYNMGPHNLAYGLARLKYKSIYTYYARACKLGRGFCGNRLYVKRFMTNRRLFTRAIRTGNLTPEYITKNFKYGRHLARNLFKEYNVSLPRHVYEKLLETEKKELQRKRLPKKKQAVASTSKR
jgi:hypothetical protein